MRQRFSYTVRQICRATFVLYLLSLDDVRVWGQTAGMPAAAQKDPALGQEAGPETMRGYTLKLRSQLAVLDVVVHNRQGEIVPDLAANDFTVLEDGVPQPIRSFEATRSQAVHGSDEAAIDSTAELDRRDPRAPVTIIALDEIVTRFEDQYFARYSVNKYLKQQPDVLDQPTMLIARRMDRTIVLSDYTTSKDKLRRALEAHLAATDWASTNPNFTGEQIAASFASLLQVARATEGHEGHKNLVWIGRGFPALQWDKIAADQEAGLKQAVTSCVEALHHARVTLYVIDPAGVAGFESTSDENGVLTLQDPFENGVGFDSLAQATGGTAMHGRNDVDRLIGDAVSAGRTFYTLTYRPTSTKSADEGHFHRIEVRLKDPALVASSREGYYASPGPASAALTTASHVTGDLATAGSTFDLASASSGLMVFDGVPLTLARASEGDQLRVSFPAAALGLSLGDGRLRGEVTLIALGFDRHGKLLTKDGRVVTLHLAVLPSGRTEDRTVTVNTPIKPEMAIARMRVVVRSEANGKLGAENFYPDGKSASGMKP